MDAGTAHKATRLPARHGQVQHGYALRVARVQNNAASTAFSPYADAAEKRYSECCCAQCAYKVLDRIGVFFCVDSFDE